MMYLLPFICSLISLAHTSREREFYVKLRNQVFEESRRNDPGNLTRLKHDAVTGSDSDDNGNVNFAPEQKSSHASEWTLGAILYYLDPETYDTSVASTVRVAMDDLETQSCIKFTPLDEPPYQDVMWLHITNPRRSLECDHEAKSNSAGEIKLTIGYNCLERHQIIHTLMHGIGFNDEITHPQRDNYVRVLWGNIQPAYQHLFRVKSEPMSGGLVDYDFQSIMHFHDRAYTRNGRPTMVPLVKGVNIKPSSTLSNLDRLKLQLYFGQECNKREVAGLFNHCMKIFRNKPQPRVN